MPYAGKTLMPRQVAELGAHTWGGVGLVKFVATILAESHGSVGAWHDNIDQAGDEGLILSRDCGLAQINIAARHIGTHVEDDLRTDSLDPAEYQEVARHNVSAASELYHHPWTRDGHLGLREWQPWVAYTSGWATFPEWWVWARPTLDHWAATGRYVQQAITGVCNYHVLLAKDRTPEQGLFLAKHFAKIFDVEGSLAFDELKGIVKWASFPPKPPAAPGDGVGPRPLKNDGR